MRVIRYLLTAFFSLAIIGIVGFFLVREGSLIYGARRLDSSLDVLRLFAARDAARTECTELAGGDLGLESEVKYQLRFLNSQDYILEAVCPLNQSNPIELGDNSLPNFVTKTPGKSGFVWAEGVNTGIQITAFSGLAELIDSMVDADTSLITRSRNIVVEDQQVKTTAEVLPKATGPTTSCEGFGYTCCDQVTQTGMGNQLSGVMQCQDSCYESCVDRPVVLSFTSNPFFDIETRTVAVSAGREIELSFVTNEKGAKSLTTEIDFGDGQAQVFSGDEGSVSHTYNCNRPLCTYEATITATNENGVSSVETPVSRMTIQVSNN